MTLDSRLVGCVVELSKAIFCEDAHWVAWLLVLLGPGAIGGHHN